MTESERQTRKQRIDTRWRALQPSWKIVRYRDGLDFSTLNGVSIEELPTANGPADYGLFYLPLCRWTSRVRAGLRAPSRLLMLAAALGLGASQATADIIFLANSGTGEIYKFEPNGARSTFASGLAGPVGLALALDGNLFVSDYFAGNIYKYSPNGTRATFASGVGNPAMLAFDLNGNLYAADRLGSGDIYKFTPDGIRTTFGSVPGRSPWGMTFDASGSLFVADNTSSILKYSPAGVSTVFASDLRDPLSLAFDSAGNLYAGLAGSGEIRKFSPAGTQSVFATGLLDPLCLAFDSAGNLFESDGVTPNSVKVFLNSDGVLSSAPVTFASGVVDPYGLAFQPVPEPSTTALMVLGVLLMLALHLRLLRIYSPPSRG